MSGFSWQSYRQPLDLQLIVTASCLLSIYPPSRNVQTGAVMQLPVLWNQEQCVHTDFAAKTARWIHGDGYFLCGAGRIPQSSWLQIVSKDAEQISIIKHWDTWISCKQLKKFSNCTSYWRSRLTDFSFNGVWAICSHLICLCKTSFHKLLYPLIVSCLHGCCALANSH